MTATSTISQPQAALGRGNMIRLERARLRREVRAAGSYQASRDKLADILDDGVPAALRTLTVHGAGEWIFHRHATTITRLLASAECSAYRDLGELSARQLGGLVNELRSQPGEAHRGR